MLTTLQTLFKMKLLTLLLLNISLNSYSQTSKEYFEMDPMGINNLSCSAAISDYNKIIELDPKDAKAYCYRGAVKVLIQDFQGAIADYTKAIEIYPEYERAYYKRGILKVELEDYQAAIADYNKAIELDDPKNIEVYYDRGFAKAQLEDYQGAVADFSKLNPENAAKNTNIRDSANYYLNLSIDALAKFTPKEKEIICKELDFCEMNNYALIKEFEQHYSNDRGKTKDILVDYLGKIVYYTKSIEIDSKDAVYLYWNRGLTKYTLHNYPGAIADYNKVIELDPKDVKAYYNRGLVKANILGHRGAMADFSKVIELDPKDAKAYYNRGLAKLELGQKDSGCLDLSKAGVLGNAEAYEMISKHCK